MGLKHKGRSAALDTLFAAIAAENGMAVAAHHRKDFECLDVELVEF